MTKFAEVAARAQTLDTIYNAIKDRMEWNVTRKETGEPFDAEEAVKEQTFLRVLEAIEGML